MTETRNPAETTSARRMQQHRRIKRGIVASYIHQISERHNDDRLAAETVVEPTEWHLAEALIETEERAA
jgi:hypothetical protein